LRTTDPRDKVYGVLGLVDPTICAALKPDYNLGARDIFLAFAEHMIKITKSLEILRAVDSTSVSNSLPSWVPNLESPSRTNIINLRSERDFSCSGMLELTVAFQYREKLQVKAILLDAVDGLGAAHKWDERWHGDAIQSPSIMQSTRSENAYGNADAIQQALWLTLLSGQTTVGDGTSIGAQKTSIDFQTVKLPARIYALAESATAPGEASDGSARFMSWFLRGNKDFKIFGMQLLPLLCAAEGVDPIDQSLIEQVMIIMYIVGTGRRLIITRNGYLGLGPAYTRSGDITAILPGCSVPMILRRSGDEFTVVGDSYVHGIMNGEAVADLQTSINMLEPLTLV
jgi:hypothetical protein